MSLLGVTVLVRATPAGRSTPAGTGTAFIAGLTEKGPTDQPVPVTSMSQYIAVFGTRQNYASSMYDWVETYFAEGGLILYVSRVVGPGALPTSGTLNNAGAQATLNLAAKNSGDWGNGLKREIIVGPSAGNFRVVRIYDAANQLLEISPELDTEAGLIAWSETSPYVTITDNATGVGVPAAVASAAIGANGTDDRANALDAHFKAALDRCGRELGPGQIAMPGRFAIQTHTDLLAHAAANNRFAECDPPDVATRTDAERATSKATLKAASTPLRVLATSKHGEMCTPWGKISGTAQGTTRDVPPSALVCALKARSDATNSPNKPAAGDNGIARYVTGLKATFTEADVDELSVPEATFAAHGSINVIRVIDGVVMMFGNRTLADPLTQRKYLQTSNVRLDMAVVAAVSREAQGFAFEEITPKNISAFETALSGPLNRLRLAGSIYEFDVNTGSQVNTSESIARGELRAVISYSRAPGAERVIVELVHLNATLPVAA